MAARLIIESGLSAGTEIVVPTSGYTTIGRSSDCTVFLHDESVAKNHARLWLDLSGRLRCHNVKKGYSTSLNGVPVSVPFYVVDGDVLQIGDIEIRFVAT